MATPGAAAMAHGSIVRTGWVAREVIARITLRVGRRAACATKGADRARRPPPTG